MGASSVECSDLSSIDIRTHILTHDSTDIPQAPFESIYYVHCLIGHFCTILNVSHPFTHSILGLPNVVRNSCLCCSLNVRELINCYPAM